MESKVKELIRGSLKDWYAKCRINSIEHVYDYVKGFDTIHVFKADVSLADFLGNKIRTNVYIEYNWKGFTEKINWD